ncbi:MAG: four helix bundle protein [Ignavibacteriae bacterium]|nr:four helix bundle protein [Ignavibacteriota bacterium]
MSIKQFEDLKVWQASREFITLTYKLTSKPNFKTDFGLKDQFQRASVSVMNNIAEGFERDNNKEFVRFLTYSKGSAGEVRSLLYVALDLEYISESEFLEHYNLAIDIITQIANFIKYLNKTK